jgi:cbb3-type cytochrome oxidase cytochrome c subunit
MTPTALTLGTLALLFTIIGIVLILPVVTELDELPEDGWRRSASEDRGRQIYIDAGCQYCHSQYVRRVDWGPYAERVAQASDYHYDRPQLLGSERIGPDLSQAGGHHSDGWHLSHFVNPRFTRPESLMPPFEYLGRAGIDDLSEYVQSLGGPDADARMQRQDQWHREAIAAFESGPDANIEWIHSHVPDGWLTVPNPYPATVASLARGELIYQQFCIGCHGPVGDGLGPAARPHPAYAAQQNIVPPCPGGSSDNMRDDCYYIYPPPLNFTTLRRTGGASGGVLYYQIMNGITGTAMPYFHHELESEKIWDLSNYVMTYFMSGREFGTDGQGIDGAHEPPQEHERR